MKKGMGAFTKKELGDMSKEKKEWIKKLSKCYWCDKPRPEEREERRKEGWTTWGPGVPIGLDSKGELMPGEARSGCKEHAKECETWFKKGVRDMIKELEEKYPDKSKEKKE